MLKEVIELQNDAVNKIIALLPHKEEITFKAPTGSGKTYMMALLMDYVLAHNPDVIFLVSSLSKGELAEQNYEQFLAYQKAGQFKNLDPFLISSETAGEERLFIEEIHNVYVLPRDLYKKKGKLAKGPMDAFLNKVTGSVLFGGLEKKIYLIKDECHIATKNLDDISDFFERKINFSATPNLKRGQYPDVEISELDAVNTHLIKHVEFGSDTESLDAALRKYNQVQKEYFQELGINPCIIIQISNKNKAEEEWKNIIEPALSRNDIKWMYIVDKDKECKTNTDLAKVPVRLWKKYAKENTSPVEAIIFKLTITEGWDIRRACMLYQIRDTESKHLDEQVLGRVRRNPRLLDFESLGETARDLACTAWVWGMPEEQKEPPMNVRLKTGEIQNEVKVRTTRIKPLEIKEAFDIDRYLSEHPYKAANTNIFSAYEEFQYLDDALKQFCREYSTDSQKWFHFMQNAGNISDMYNRYICDYSKSMELVATEYGTPKESTFPFESCYMNSNDYITISENVWQRVDSSEKFAFDSDAEKHFAELLKDISPRCTKELSTDLEDIYLWGKNYLANSEIKYEYYNKGIHVSYPDFIMLDIHDRINLFEVKSFNKSSQSMIDVEDYKQKVNALKKCYLYASKLTRHIFYIPILEGETWKIYRYKDGIEDLITKSQLKDAMRKADDVE